MDGGDSVEVTREKRLLLFSVACSHVLLCSGEAYGWTALRPVLIDSGLFGAFDPTTRNTLMNTVATWGIAANALCKLPLGFCLDKLGPRATACLGAVFVMVGSVMMAYAAEDDKTTPVLGYFLLGMGGPFLQMPCFQFSELFGSGKASAMAFLITCFELSTGVFWVFQQLHDNLGYGRQELFLGYSIVGAYCLITAIFLWPDLPYRAQPPQQRPPSAAPPANKAQSASFKNTVANTHPLMDKPLMTQICSVPFAYVTLFLTTHIFRQGFLIGTLGPQVEAFFPDAKLADTLKGLFNIILPLGFIPMMFCTASGFAGYILNRPKLAFVFVTLISMVYGLLLLVHTPESFITLFVIFPVARQFVFSTFFSFSANTFGYASFGRIAGVASTVAGLVQLTQTSLVAIATKPGSWLDWQMVDLLLGSIPCILFLYPIGSWIYACAEKEKEEGFETVQDEEDGDGTPLMGRRDSRHGTPMSVPNAGASFDEDYDAGAPVCAMSYAEASSYGSQSASSFAALYSKFVTEDVKVMVRPVTPDNSIHVSSWERASSSAAYTETGRP